jgi:hypothetical protein
MYKQILRSVKLITGKKGQEIEWTGRGPLRRRRSALDCSATEEEEEEETVREKEIFLSSRNVRFFVLLMSVTW